MTTLSEIGEEKIIETIKKEIGQCKELNNEIGKDDCAVLNYNNKKIAYSSDLLTRTNHFPKESTFYEMGWKTLAVNLSDLASMGATPLFSTTSMALPDIEQQNLKKLAKGMKDCSKKFDLCLAGGDTNKSNELILDTSIIGELGKNILYRKNATPGQYVAVTNNLGTAAFGLKIIQEKLDIKKDLKKKALDKLFKPEPQIKKGKKISKKPNNAAIDISDGLFISLDQLANASETGIKINIEEVPINESIEKIIKDNDLNKEDLLKIGGDYELLFTTNKKEIIEKTNSKKIGKVIKKEGIWINNNKKEIEGYRHF